MKTLKSLLFFFVNFLMLISCSSSKPDSRIWQEQNLLEMGIILEYEFSPNGSLMAILVPTDAIYPNSNRFENVMMSELTGDVRILVFNTKDYSLVFQSEIFGGYTIHNLDWSQDSTKLLYLQKQKQDSNLIVWDLIPNSITSRNFPYKGFNLSDDGATLVAWGRSDNMPLGRIDFYLFPQLAKIKIISTPFVRDIVHTSWLSNTQLIVEAMQPDIIFKLDVTVEEYEIVLNERFDRKGSFSIDYGDSFLVFESIMGGLSFFRMEGCNILNYKKDEEIISQPEWSPTSQDLYFIRESFKNKSFTLVKAEFSPVGDLLSLACLP